jgi:hypothetical protein
MNKKTAGMIAATLLLSSAPAMAHGLHEGLHGLVHELTSPGHFGLVLLGAAGTALFGRRIKGLFARRSVRQRNDVR